MNNSNITNRPISLKNLPLDLVHHIFESMDVLKFHSSFIYTTQPMNISTADLDDVIRFAGAHPRLQAIVAPLLQRSILMIDNFSDVEQILKNFDIAGDGHHIRKIVYMGFSRRSTVIPLQNPVQSSLLFSLCNGITRIYIARVNPLHILAGIADSNGDAPLEVINVEWASCAHRRTIAMLFFATNYTFNRLIT